MNILVLLPNNLGDTIMATPVLEGLTARYPGCHITFFAEQGFGGALHNNPHCDTVFLFPRRQIRDMLYTQHWPRAKEELKNITAQLNDRAFDMVVNLSQVSYLSHLCSNIRAQRFAGQRFLPEGNHAVGDSWSQYLYTVAFARKQNALHATDIYRRIAQVTRHNGYTIVLMQDEKEKAAGYLSGLGIDLSRQNLIVFQPGAALPSKRWPAKSFVELGRMLCADGWRVVISGAPSEQETAEEICENIGDGCFCAAGKTTFREAIALVSCAKACVTGDTALMHAAAACGVQVYALFGATSPVETGPYGDGHWVFSAQCNDRPCFCTHCKNMLCMKAILPSTVYACIRTQNPGENPRCDVYRTQLKPDGDYRLLPSHHAAFSYTSPTGSAVTRMLFEPEYTSESLNRNDLNETITMCREFADILGHMHRYLLQFLDSRNSDALHAFEQKKEELTESEGLTAFFAALLNIRLNSVPVLEAWKGVQLSAGVCASMRNDIESLCAKLDSMGVAA